MYVYVHVLVYVTLGNFHRQNSTHLRAHFRTYMYSRMMASWTNTGGNMAVYAYARRLYTYISFLR